MTESERAQNLLAQYVGAECESCNKPLDSPNGPARPGGDVAGDECESFEHEMVWQAHRAEYWRSLAPHDLPEPKGAGDNT